MSLVTGGDLCWGHIEGFSGGKDVCWEGENCSRGPDMYRAEGEFML